MNTEYRSLFLCESNKDCCYLRRQHFNLTYHILQADQRLSSVTYNGELDTLTITSLRLHNHGYYTNICVIIKLFIILS